MVFRRGPAVEADPATVGGQDWDLGYGNVRKEEGSCVFAMVGYAFSAWESSTRSRVRGVACIERSVV